MPKNTKTETKTKKIENDENENSTFSKLSHNSEKYLNELSGEQVELTTECENIDSQVSALEEKVTKITKNKNLSEDQQFLELRNIYLQVATCIARLDDLSAKIMHSLNAMFKAKKNTEMDDVDDDGSDEEQPTKIGKQKKDKKSESKKQVESDDEDDSEDKDHDEEKPSKKEKSKKKVESDDEKDDEEKPSKKEKSKKKVESDNEEEKEKEEKKTKDSKSSEKKKKPKK